MQYFHGYPFAQFIPEMVLGTITAVVNELKIIVLARFSFERGDWGKLICETGDHGVWLNEVFCEDSQIAFVVVEIRPAVKSNPVLTDAAFFQERGLSTAVDVRSQDSFLHQSVRSTE